MFQRASDRISTLFLILGTLVAAAFACAQPARAAIDRDAPLEGLVDVGGVRLSYLDWGGGGPTIILLHGLGDSPHGFDELAPALARHHHVIAYARRGSGNSDVHGPYDLDTLTADLIGLMNAFGVQKATLVGWSAGGNEITEVAALHPDRVTSLVYLDAGIDMTDPEFRELLKRLPGAFFAPPANATSSFDAYLAYQQRLNPSLDIHRIEGSIRDKIVLHSDGTVSLRIPKETVDALYAAAMGDHRKRYSDIACPVLAIYAQSLYDLGVTDPAVKQGYIEFETKYWKPWLARSKERLQKEVRHARVVDVPGVHGTFIIAEKARLVGLIESFLSQQR
jgi:pimeloyl-ACP methyl ester carboxylesterase